ncbi:hypothetical protein AX17_001521 [Amanita inopinata Kibby_2008]|nr:hypothetical protein AX17_001521 [Amanita inopinata Kibby_2008]
MWDEDETLVGRRSRRSTAGNRMQVALAEMAVDEESKDLDDDVDFVNYKDEEDIFESDFESTDEEAMQVEVAAGENDVQDEERRAKKQAKSKLEKATAAADARLRVTFNPDAANEDKASQKPKPRRRVSLGLAVNVETGEVIVGDGSGDTEGKNGSTAVGHAKIRQSQRKHTVQNTVETVQRMRWSEEKRAAAPKKTKITRKSYTQGELIARALDNEEGNIVEHRDYLHLEEEKRKRARVVKTAVEGPLVRWLSRVEDVKVTIQPAPPPSAFSFPVTTIPSSNYPYSFSYRSGAGYSDLYGFARQHQPPYVTSSSGADTKDSLSTANDTRTDAQTVMPVTTPLQISSVVSMPASATTSTSVTPTPTASSQLLSVSSTPAPNPQEQLQPVEKIEKVTKNYVIHELGQLDGIRKPNWTETMGAMFGDHVKWDEIRVYVGKGRPLSRPKQICPITGKQAVYMDPRTGVPYADVRAFRALSGLLEHEYDWNAELGCYVGKGDTAKSATERDPSTDVAMDAARSVSFDPFMPPTTAHSARPYTGQSRPTTARPTTAASTRYEGSYIVAVLEGRGVAREVGIAALDKDTGHVMLVQLADCQTYVKTLHQMHLHTPCIVLVPDTFLSASDGAFAPGGKRSSSTSMLVEYVSEEFPGVAVEPVGRKYWNDAGGLNFVVQLCVDDEERAGTVLAVSNKYYALSAACALFKHAEAKFNMRFATASLCMRYVPVDGTMMIDPESAKNLELVGNITHQKSQHSLFGTLNHTFTPMAARLLRSNILSPLTVQRAIDARLDVIEEVISSEDRFTEVRIALKALVKLDFDKLIVSLVSSEARVKNTAKPASQRVTQMLNLRNIVRSLPLLRQALAGSRTSLLTYIYEMLCDERLDRIEKVICENLNEDSLPSKGGIGAVNARVYAIRANCNPLLDVARETYKENISDIFQLNCRLSDEYSLPLTLLYQDTGFVFTLKKSELEAAGGELPKGFINVVCKKGKLMFSSMELKKLNARMKDALDESLMLSDKIVLDLVAEIITDISALYKASEAIALVDMLWSFAHTSIMRSYVRPEFTGTLAIKAGRHPVLEIVQSAGTVIANDAYCDNSSTFQIIHGPNMSGKSTYLRQIALLTVLAMCGCFVPAEYSSFRLHDALLTRLSNDDDLERNLSTFASEMASSAMILSLATPRSLILIDELGRGTSPIEGMGICYAIAESLIALKPFVFFATHFVELATTLSRQPNVINLHLAVQRSQKTKSNLGMSFKYKIADGVSEEMHHYGLELARLADLPEDILVEGRKIAKKLAALQAKHQEESESGKIAIRRKALLRLRTQLTQALDHSTLPQQDLLDYISRFQKEIAKVLLEST